MSTSPKQTKLSPEVKKILLDLIKSIDIKELTVENEEHKKWFRFGAYEMGRIISEKIKDTKEPTG